MFIGLAYFCFNIGIYIFCLVFAKKSMATAANNRDDAVMLELKENGAVGTFEDREKE